ncbi:hypothetical protein NDU88_005949 [Pleurodeles waltl]|uniref:Uncharacterized protein n=1 Tax=Pleurodeles waltl TaxID=8319 RepID=A0AAV7LR04_PLEWA|nr:hypothetical protein NDU88_005949 [Pleurodeles waltl]
MWGRGLAVEENGRLRKNLCAPGRPSWQTEGLPPAILTPGVASRLVERGGLRRGEVAGPERRQPRPEMQETMPNDKTASKHSRQLLFSEAIAQPKAMTAQTAPQGHTSPPVDQPTLDATDRILQEIASVGRRLEAMDLKITDLTLASSSIRADIAGFRETANNLDQRLSVVDDHIAATPDQEDKVAQS